MVANQIPHEFVKDTGDPNATLKFRCKDYHGYAVVNFGNEAAARHTTQKVLELKRMANCHPPLPNNHLVFTKLSKSVRQSLSDPNFLKAVDPSDPIKLFLKSLGLLALRAFEEGLKVDMNLDNIYCCTIEDTFILTKCIALPPGVLVEFAIWKDEMIKFYKEIEKIPGRQNMFDGFEKFMKLLEKAKSKEEFRSIINGWMLWDTDKRMMVLYKLTGMLNSHGLYFIDFCGGAKNILLWRQTLSQDKVFKDLVEECRENWFCNRSDCSSYKRDEVYLFLRSIRNCLGHFRTSQTGLTSEAMMVTYLDSKFEDIMEEVYLGCQKLEESGRFSFGIK